MYMHVGLLPTVPRMYLTMLFPHVTHSHTHSQRMLNSAQMTEAGPLSMLSEDEGELDDDEREADIKLPGVSKGGCD